MNPVLSTRPLTKDDPAPSPPIARGIFEQVLRDDSALTQALIDDESLTVNIQKLLGIAVVGLGIHGIAVGVVASQYTAAAWPLESFFWTPQGHPVVWMPIALVGAMLGALAICLPSFYFYTQLAGLDASFRTVTAQSLRVLARTSVLLLGALPFYVALALASTLGILPTAELLAIGVLLPFVVGLAGIFTLYRAFGDLAHLLPITHSRRGNVLLRLVAAWGMVFTAVAPVALYRIARALDPIL